MSDERSFEEIRQQKRDEETRQQIEAELTRQKTEEKKSYIAAFPDTITYEKSIKEYLTQYVSGQNEALDLLSFIGHLYTVKLYGMKHGVKQTSLPRLNALITGPTGFGKSFMIKKLAEALNMKYKKIDLTSIRAEGWHGTNLGEAIHEFLKMSPYGIGILHFDEFDKIGTQDGYRDDHKLELQGGLLDLLDHQYSHFLDSHRHNGVKLDNANNALIILSGSFQTVRDAEKVAKKTIGFSSECKKILDGKAWKSKLKDLGYMRELIGRILTSIELEKYTEKQIMTILKDTKASPLLKMGHLMGQHDILHEDELEDIVSCAYESENGMRELESMIFEKVYEKRKK